MKTTIDELLESLRQNNNIVKFTTGARNSGHSGILYYNSKEGTYYLINSVLYTQEAERDLKEESWMQCLKEKLGKEVKFILKNKQYSNQGCVFANIFTEHCLRQGMELQDIPSDMPRDLENIMMAIVYLTSRSSYETDNLIDLDSSNTLPEWVYVDAIKVTEKDVIENIMQHNGGYEKKALNLIKACKQTLNALLPQQQQQQGQQQQQQQQQGLILAKNTTGTYFGYMNNHDFQGLKIFQKKNGEKYVGEWERGQQHGKGIHIWPDREKYEGNWGNNIQEGFGIYTWPNGEKYVGNFTKGDREGFGIHTWPNGEKYVGEWERNLKHGKGHLYMARWKERRKGISK